MSGTSREDPEVEKPPSCKSLGEGAAEHLKIDHVAEKKLVAKLDLYIIPIIMMLYLFSFLDR